MGSRQAFLRELSSSRPYPLSDSEETHIGRDARCLIRIEDHRHVSRHHAVLRHRWAEQTWELCDLGSINGTFVNGVRLQGCRELCVGDRIQLGQSGPKFLFESKVVSPVLSPSGPEKLAQQDPQDLSDSTQIEPTPQRKTPLPPGRNLTATQLFPILSTGRDLTQKAFLIPGSLTVLVVVSLFLTVGQPERFNPLLASYLGAVGYYFIYQLCGKHKPWWLLVGTAAFTLGLLSSPVLTGFLWFFRELLPGQIPPSGSSLPFPILFGRMLLGAGLMEEMIKALPVLFLLLLGRVVAAPWHHRLGVWEPLDGILLGAASAVGFTLLETLGQYVPNAAQVLGETAVDAQLAGLQLLIPRLLGSIAGHMAYSGYFGYFIGLSVLMPRHRWRILAVGYGTASLLHALWNVMGSYSALLLTVVGVLSYAFLVAAILKARALSPTRSQNFATRLVETPTDP